MAPNTDLSQAVADGRPAALSGRAKLLWPFLAGLLIVSWSSGFIGIRYASEHAGVVTVLFWRTLVSGLILLPFALARGGLHWRDVAWQMLYGAMVVFLYLGGFALAIEQRVPTGLVALISDLVPLAIAVLSWLILGEVMRLRQWVGTAVAVVGVLIVSRDGLTLGQAPVSAYVITVLSMLVFALASVLQKRLKSFDMPLQQSLCIQFLTGALLFGICALWTGRGLPPAEPGFFIGIAWLVLIATFLCYAIYYTSLRLYPASQVSAAIYLSPPVTMIWGWALFSEPLTLTLWIGLAVTFAGVALATLAPARA